MSLAVFNISKVVENGAEITPEFDSTSGTIRYVAHPIAPIALIQISTLLATQSHSSALLSLALRKLLHSLRKMPTTEYTKMYMQILAPRYTEFQLVCIWYSYRDVVHVIILLQTTVEARHS